VEKLFERCAGLDVHKKGLTACLRVPDGRGGRRQQTRSFRTTTAGLLALRDWLQAEGVTLVGMESTGPYWKPVYHLLEQAFECWLLNAHHLRNVPGRKTDVKDAEWICQLVEHGLVRPSFVPPQPIRELRNLTRYRKSVIEERTGEAQRLEKLLEDAGIKLSSVASDILGASGRAMLRALVGGSRDPEALADLAKGTLRRKIPALREALAGRFEHHHAILVAEMLSRIEAAEETIERLSAEIEQVIAPFAEQLALLQTIPGVQRRVAEVIVAETGGDMSRFSSAAHLASWAGMCPGNDESAGKRRSGRTRRGSKWLRTALVQGAHALAKGKPSYLASQYWRIAGRRGKPKAAMAVGHSILVIAYHVLARREPYTELGADYLLQRESAQAHVRRLVRQLERLGNTVTLDPKEVAA
jgi:transposase